MKFEKIVVAGVNYSGSFLCVDTEHRNLPSLQNAANLLIGKPISNCNQ